MADTFNYLSSRANSIIGGGIPTSIFSLVIVNFDQTIEKVNFQVPPENISETKSANYASENVLGRFEPIRMYTNSSSTKITFEVKYYWLEDSLVNNVNSWNGIKDNVNKLRACLYPVASAKPPTVAAALSAARLDHVRQHTGHSARPHVWGSRRVAWAKSSEHIIMVFNSPQKTFFWPNPGATCERLDTKKLRCCEPTNTARLKFSLS